MVMQVIGDPTHIENNLNVPFAKAITLPVIFGVAQDQGVVIYVTSSKFRAIDVKDEVLIAVANRIKNAVNG